MPGYVPTTDPSVDDTTMIPAGPDALQIQMRRQMLRDRLAAQSQNGGDSDIGGVPSTPGQTSVSPANAGSGQAGPSPVQLEPIRGNDTYRGVRFHGIDPTTIPQGPSAGGVGGGSPLDEIIQRALARQAGAVPMTGSANGVNYSMMPSANVSRPQAQDVTSQWLAAQDRARTLDVAGKAAEAAKYGADAPIRLLEAQGKQTAAQSDRERAWAINPANPAYQTAQRQGRLADTQEQGEEAKLRATQADNAPDPTHPGMTVGQVRQARQSALGQVIPMLANRGPAGRSAAAGLMGKEPGLSGDEDVSKALGTLGKTTLDDVLPKIQPDIDAMKAEVATHTMRYGPEQAERTNATMKDILARAKAEGLEGPELDELGNRLMAEVRKVTSKTNPYASAGSALLGTLTGGLAGERAAP